MRLYSVHAPPEEPLAPERFLFIKEGISWPALFLPVIYILWHRMWLTLVYYIVYLLVIAWIGRLAGQDMATLAALLGGILFALEANNLRRLSLERRGWREVGGTSGRRYGEAEARFFTRWSGEVEPAPRSETPPRPPSQPEAHDPATEEPIFGLFPEPEH
jgi:Protein of unknown function (DUF2628)